MCWYASNDQESSSPQCLSGQVHALHSRDGNDLEGRRLARLLQRYWALYSGFRTNVVAVPIFHSLFFLLYESLKTKIIDEGYSHETAYLSGTMIAGSLCNIVTNPIWVVRTRLMAQYLHHESNHYKTTAPFSIIRQMYQEVLFLLVRKDCTRCSRVSCLPCSQCSTQWSTSPATRT